MIKLRRRGGRNFGRLVFVLLITNASIAAAKELSGIELRCCVLVQSPNVEKTVRDGKSEYTGLAIDYLSRLESSLGFKCKSLREYGTDEAPAPKGFEGFTGFVEGMAKCAVGNDTSKCPCDIGTAGIGATAARFGLVDFVYPLFGVTLGIGQSVAELEESTGGWLIFKPFSLQVWIGVASIVFLHVFVTLFDKQFAAPTVDDGPPTDTSRFGRFRWTLTKTSLLRRLRLGFFSTVFAMIGHVAPGEETARCRQQKSPSTRQKALSLVGNLIGLFLVLTFEAGLVVQLFENRKTSRFRTIDDFKGCRRLKASDLCIPAGGAAEGFWKHVVAFPGSERARNCPDDKPMWITSNGGLNQFEESVRMATSGESGSCKFVLAASHTLLTYARGDYCGDFTVVGEPFYTIYGGFVLPKGSRFTDPLSRETLMLHEQNVLKSPLEIANQQKCNYGNEAATQLDWSLLGILFYVSWIGLFIILLFMIVCPEPLPKHPADDGDRAGKSSGTV